VLLTSWVEHNKQHSEKVRKWTERAKDTKDNPIYNSILQAAQEMEETNERLSQLVADL